jgi:acetolactate synthase-1/2/3 large subunit
LRIATEIDEAGRIEKRGLELRVPAAHLGRGIENSEIGTTIADPYVDYATVARGFGVHGEGPISDPAELAPALKRAIAVVKSGHPALIDVVTDPR